MKFLLFPFAFLYGLGVFVRNFLFDRGLLKQNTYPFPVIGVGNLRVGGTGKTPMVAYLASLLEKDKFHIAVLSRGYGRKSKGYVLASDMTEPEIMGDESYLLKSKFPKSIVAVDENRVHGIEKLRKEVDTIDVVLLDDSFQHRSVKPGFSILLTAYSKLYIDDYLLPVGRLREPAFGAARADCIVVTKCPPKLDIHTRRTIRERLRPRSHQQVFFAYEHYSALNSLTPGSNALLMDSIKNHHILLVTGLADPSWIFDHLEELTAQVVHLKFPDHHWFTEVDLDDIIQGFESIDAKNKLIITTEKDAQRLKKWIQSEKFAKLPWYSIEHQMMLFPENAKDFQKTIDEFIRSYK
ncbi:MAG: tetraacyldisaccharide 4'-kinase [Salibacteraceae bacterium]